MSDIVLSSSTMRHLHNTRNVAKQTARANERISTGKNINNIMDGADGYYKSKRLDSKVSELTASKSEIDMGISSLRIAMNSLSSAESLIEQMKALSVLAKYSDSAEKTKEYESQAKILSGEYDSMIKGANFDGVNLLKFTEVLGPELVTNGDFDDGRAGWGLWGSSGADATIEDSGGRLHVVKNNPNASGRFWTNVNVDAGATYRLSLDLEVIEGGNLPASFYTYGGNIGYVLDTGHNIFEMTPSSTGVANLNFGLASNSRKEYYMDNVSLREIQAPASAAVIDVNFSATSKYSITGVDASAKNLDIDSQNIDFDSSINIDDTIARLEAAISKIGSYEMSFDNSKSFLETRLNFTENMISETRMLSNNITKADITKESANLQALETKEQLSSNSYKITQQFQNSLISFFRGEL